MLQHSPEVLVPVCRPGELNRGDQRACARLIRSGSKSFFVASLLLPAAVRADALVLYAFCRLADDAVDLEGEADSVSRLRERIAWIYSGKTADAAVDRAFAAVVQRQQIPRALPEALLEGFAWDLQGRRYPEFEDLVAYAVRVAGSVGIMMACLMHTRTPEALARACDLGVAMQLTNIARDVGEDARAARLYLPTSWLREAGLDVEHWMQRPVFCPALQSVIARLLAAAEVLYERSAVGIGMLPVRCRWSIHAALMVYAEIGRQLLRCGVDPVAKRTVVSTPRKLALMARSALRSVPQPGPVRLPLPLVQGKPLIDAVLREPVPTHSPEAAASKGWDHAMARLVEIFEALEQRDRLAADKTSAR